MADGRIRSPRRVVVRLLGLVLLAFVLSSLDWQRFDQIFRRPSVGAVVAAAALVFAMHALKGLRWHWLTGVFGFRRSIWTSYIMYVSGLFLGYLTPGRVGEAVRVLHARGEGASTEGAVVAAVVDRVLDLAVTILFAGSWIVLSVWWEPTLELLLLGYALLALAACVAWGLLLLTVDAVSRAASVRRVLARLGGVRAELSVRRLSSSLRLVTVVRFAGLLAVSTPIWLTYYSAVFFLAVGLGAEFSFADTIGLGAGGSLAALVPITFAGLGTREGTLVVLAGLRGRTPEEAIALSAAMLGIYGLSMLLTAHGWLLWKPRAAAGDEVGAE